MYPVKLITLKGEIVACRDPKEMEVSRFETDSLTTNYKILETPEKISNKAIVPIMQWCSTRVINETLHRQSYGLEGAENTTEYIAVDFKESQELDNYVEFYIRENTELLKTKMVGLENTLNEVKLDLVVAEFSANSKQRRLARISRASFWTRFKWLFTGVGSEYV
jgi:hypothetical protein